MKIKTRKSVVTIQAISILCVVLIPILVLIMAVGVVVFASVLVR